mgnify:CR=1 FL=1
MLPILAAVLAFITIGGLGWAFVGGGDSTTLRGQLRWNPSDRLEVGLSADLIRTSDNGQPSLSTNFSPTDLYPAALYGVSIPGDPPPSPAAPKAATRWACASMTWRRARAASSSST